MLIGAWRLALVVAALWLSQAAAANGTLPGPRGVELSLGFDPSVDDAWASLASFSQLDVPPPIGDPEWSVGVPASGGRLGGQAKAWAPTEHFADSPRVWSATELIATWLAGGGDTAFGMTDLEASATFCIPGPLDAPWTLTPGFAARLWDGPAGYDLPHQVYDAFVDASWTPPLTQRLSLHLGLSPGVYGDFAAFDRRAFLVPARALAIFDWTPSFRLLGGLVYTDRLQPRVLPVGGLVWWPSEAMVLELLLPRPRVAMRLGMLAGMECWGYVGGEFGGGNWLVRRGDDSQEVVNYSDLRALAGVEWSRGDVVGRIEAGYVFERDLIFDGPTPSLEPDDTLLLRTGIIF